MKDAGIFVGHEKTGIFFGYCIFHQLKLTMIQAQCTTCVGFFWVCKKNRDFFWVEPRSDPSLPPLPVFKVSEWGPLARETVFDEGTTIAALRSGEAKC